MFVQEGKFDKEQADYLGKLVNSRLEGKPVQYVLGETEFFGLPFRVDERVLIPRPETELIVEAALRFLENRKQKRVLDLCTGSGCIAISIAKLEDVYKRQPLDWVENM